MPIVHNIMPGDVLKINGIETFVDNYAHYIAFGPTNEHGIAQDGKLFAVDRWAYLGRHDSQHWFVHLTDLETLPHDGQESITCHIGTFWQLGEHYIVSGDDETDTPFAKLPKEEWEVTYYNLDTKICDFADAIYVGLCHKLNIRGLPNVCP